MESKQPDIDLREYLEFARGLSIKAGLHTLKYFRKSFEVMVKQDKSPVTVADRETEALISRSILDRYPDHGILGEEHGTVESGSPFKWVIDPIDGTKSFVHGIPLYTVLIALLYKGEPCVGVIHNPLLEETAYAATGNGCYLNGTRCSVSETKSLADAWVQVTDPANLCQLYPDFTPRLFQRAGHCRTWADGYGYLLVATGRADAMMDPIMALWDVAPLKVVVTEAGGSFSDFGGAHNALGESAIASNGRIHSEILSIIH